MDDDVVRELTYSGRRRREFLMARWRMITAVAVATALLVGGGPAAWRLAFPTMNLSNTPELALDAWAQRREIEPTWRACDDADPTADGWHLCRLQVGEAPAVELWCGGDQVAPIRRTCTFERAPRMPVGWSALDLPVAPGPTSGTLGGMASTPDTKHIKIGEGSEAKPAKPGDTAPGQFAGPNDPPEAGGGTPGAQTPAGPARTNEQGAPQTDNRDGRDPADRQKSGR